MSETRNLETTAMMPADVQKRMEEILRKHGENYRRDLPGLIDSLHLQVENLRAGRDTDNAAAVLEREAHDMKGQAATFGLPGIALLAGSLCHIVSRGTRPDPRGVQAIDAHVAGLKALLGGDDQALVEAVLADARLLER